MTANGFRAENRELRAEVSRMENTITTLRAEVEQHQRSFDLRWDASMRAIARWQEANPGNDLNWPDHADLVVWLLERDAALRAENDNLRAALRECLGWHDYSNDMHKPIEVRAAYMRARAALEEKR